MGYSSIYHLSRMLLDCLKIDQIFVRTLGVGSANPYRLKAMANLAKELGMRIVLEGLQNENEEFTLWQLGLNQG